MSPSRLQLPIDLLESEISSLCQKMARGEVPARAVIEAPTGSGKSTRVASFLLDSGVLDGDILVLQPRRMAARLLARRVAHERGSDDVGYQVRFDRRGGKNTRIWFITEGILLRRLMSSSGLAGVSAVVFDEFHERHHDADLGIALLSKLQTTKRPDLQLWVMSATLDGVPLNDWCPAENWLKSEGRTFPVEIEHVRREPKATERIWDRAVSALEAEIVARKSEGDALVFMPGRFEIQKTVDAIRASKWAKGFRVLPLFGEMTPEAQDAVVDPSNERKIVVSTNVAETSLTIPGIRIVIDSGLARIADYDARRGLNTLMVKAISRASADQRAGRAGRVAPGRCMRLWTANHHATRPSQLAPEINRLDLCGAFLQLAASGYGDLAGVDWIETPNSERATTAAKTLEDLGAVELTLGESLPVMNGTGLSATSSQSPQGARASRPFERCARSSPSPENPLHSESSLPVIKITDLGRTMAVFPIHPRWARFLIAMADGGFDGEGAAIVALAEGRSLWTEKKGGAAFVHADDDSDWQPLLRAFEGAAAHRFDLGWCRDHGVHAGAAREAHTLMKQISRIAEGAFYERSASSGIGGADLWPTTRRALLAAFPDHVGARKSKGTLSCSLADGRSGKIQEGSVARSADLVLAGEMIEIDGRDVTVVLGQVTAISIDDLRAVWPDRLCEEVIDRFDERNKRVMRFSESRFGDLVLDATSRDGADKATAAQILATKVASGEMVLKNWNDKVEQWIARVLCVATHMPQLEIAPIDDEAKLMIFAEICEGGFSQRDIKDKDVWSPLRGWLSAAQRQALDYYAPDSITLENGRDAKVRYTPEGVPEISMQLQRLYDVNKHPTLGDGRVPVTVHILAPSQRPVQTTGDLGSFWKTSYEAVKKDLKGRYPKHEWR